MPSRTEEIAAAVEAAILDALHTGPTLLDDIRHNVSLNLPRLETESRDWHIKTALRRLKAQGWIAGYNPATKKYHETV